MAVAYIEKPWFICHPGIYFVLYLPCSWVIGCIPGSSILTSTNGGKPPYRYRWSWTSVTVAGETMIFTCTFQGFGTWFLQDLSVLVHCSPGATELNFPIFCHENKDLNVFSRKLFSLYRQETNTLATAHTSLVALFTIMLNNLPLRSLLAILFSCNIF